MSSYLHCFFFLWILLRFIFFKTIFINGFKHFDFDMLWFNFPCFSCMGLVELLRFVGYNFYHIWRLLAIISWTPFLDAPLRNFIINNMFIIRPFEVVPKFPSAMIMYLRVFFSFCVGISIVFIAMSSNSLIFFSLISSLLLISSSVFLNFTHYHFNL